MDEWEKAVKWFFGYESDRAAKVRARSILNRELCFIRAEYEREVGFAGEREGGAFGKGGDVCLSGISEKPELEGPDKGRKRNGVAGPHGKRGRKRRK